MSEPMRQHPLDPRAPGSPAPTTAQRGPRPLDDDPLEELARILGETGGYPARPETTVEIGRRATPQRAMPQQLSALEAQLFEELRSSVAPEDRVRGEFAREVPAHIPQRPVNDHEIASLRIDAGAEAPRMMPRAQAAMVPPPVDAGRQETPYADYYAYDDGVAAGSYDPAFAVSPPIAPQGAIDAHGAVHHGDVHLRPTFEEFGAADIAMAAQETSPYAAAEPVIRPHSLAEERAASRLPKQKSNSVLTTVLATVGALVVGGGAYAGWKFYGGEIGASGPVAIHADAKPLKVRGKETDKADAQPTLQPDNPSGATKIYSAQEDPVEQVRGVSPEGKEVRVINPGAPRSNPDQPHTVKTVIVRPDGSIVTDGGAPVRSATPPRAAEPVQPVSPVAPPVAMSNPASPPTSIGDIAAQGGTVPVRTASTPATPPGPVVKTIPVVAVPATPPAAPKAAAPAVVPPAAAPAPVAKAPVSPTAVPPALAPSATAKANVPPPAAPVAPKPAPATASGSTPMTLGPNTPRMASAPAPTPAAPPPAAVASSASGDWMVQISASKSDAEARRSASDAQKRFSALSGRSIDVQTANLGDKGTFYRTRFAAGSKEQAAALCQQITAQGGQCMVVKR